MEEKLVHASAMATSTAILLNDHFELYFDFIVFKWQLWTLLPLQLLPEFTFVSQTKLNSDKSVLDFSYHDVDSAAWLSEL